MQFSKASTLQERLNLSSEPRARFIADAEHSFSIRELVNSNRINRNISSYSGKSVFIRTSRQISTIIAALTLDGIASRILLCPFDIPDDKIPDLMAVGEADYIISEQDIDLADRVETSEPNIINKNIATEWVLFTSGTSGMPKLVQHSLESLTAPLGDGLIDENAVWSTFYDIRRYGGLQILLRALLGGSSMVLSDPFEEISDFVERAGAAGVTHISGTPSHWRRALMSGASNKMNPSYVRLSGEVATQNILDHLKLAYPGAQIGHAFASTEAGVAFSVNDGYAGFPLDILNQPASKPDIKIESGTLRIRSNATATKYLGNISKILKGTDGYVDTGDVVQLVNDRYIFSGRREGVINVGGQKVHPEEVEETINMHPYVSMSRVWGRSNSITGTLIVADICLTVDIKQKDYNFKDISADIINLCQNNLPPHKVPTKLNEVAEIPMSKSGKVARQNA